MKVEDMLKRARGMQQRIEDVREAVKSLTATGESGGGIVKVTLNGSYEALRVSIAPAALAEAPAVIEDLVAAAINDASHRMSDLQEERMNAAIKEIGLPPGATTPF